MLRKTLILCTSLTAAAALAAPALLRQEMPQPTEEHRMLLKGVGEWEGVLRSYMPGTPEEPAPATETVEAIGEFWIQTRFECEFMGMPYVGSGCVGYDPVQERFVGTWIDNFSTHLAVMEGRVDPESGLLVMEWEAPMTPGGPMVPHRYEAEHMTKGNRMTFYMGEGDGTKTMVIEMKRKAREAGAAK